MLHWAVDRDQTTIVEELLRRKASPNVQVCKDQMSQA